MAYEMVMPYHLHMPSYFLETFTEYPKYIDSVYAYLLFTCHHPSHRPHRPSHPLSLISWG